MLKGNTAKEIYRTLVGVAAGILLILGTITPLLGIPIAGVAVIQVLLAASCVLLGVWFRPPQSEVRRGGVSLDTIDQLLKKYFDEGAHQVRRWDENSIGQFMASTQMHIAAIERLLASVVGKPVEAEAKPAEAEAEVAKTRPDAPGPAQDSTTRAYATPLGSVPTDVQNHMPESNGLQPQLPILSGD